jgi:hypothetical protein
MNLFKGLLMLTLPTASVTGQIEHALTMEPCQADRGPYESWAGITDRFSEQYEIPPFSLCDKSFPKYPRSAGLAGSYLRKD